MESAPSVRPERVATVPATDLALSSVAVKLVPVRRLLIRRVVLRSAAEGAVPADWLAAMAHAGPRVTPEPKLRALVKKLLLMGALESLKSDATVTPDELVNAIWLEAP